MESYISAQNERQARWGELASSYESKTKMMEDQRKQLETAHQDLDSKKAALAEQNLGSNVSDSDILVINAGGQIVRVSRGTLTQTKGTRLEALFSGRWEKQLHRDAKGHIFLDVNPTCFKSIVDYLNECKIAPPECLPDPPHVDAENRAFLDGLLIAFGLDDILARPMDSTILSDVSHVQALFGFLEEDNIEGGLELLYRGTRDGMDPGDFHQKCDNQGATLTVVKSSEGFIFGGFADKSWQSSGDWISSEKAFLFGLHCAGGQIPVKLAVKSDRTSDAIYHHASHGPAYGGGYDLVFLGSQTYSTPGSTYALPTGANRHFFTGSQNFVASDVEVFKVDPSLRGKASKSSHSSRPSGNSGPWEEVTFSEFPEEIETSLDLEKAALLEATNELADLQDAFEKEQVAIQLFAQGGDSEIVNLNVSGHSMAVKHSTLGQFPDSVLYKQFADPLWKNSGKITASCARNWTSTQVVDWAKAIQGLSVDVDYYFCDVTGPELLAMGREDIKELGNLRPGTIALLAESIQKLRDEEAERSATFIEHSDYCFGKIIDLMRLKAMSGVGVPVPNPPDVREPERKRFKRIVEFYFPNETSAQFLG